MLRLFTLAAFICFSSSIQSQMLFNGQNLYGNEWIKPGQAYWKFKVSADGIYRINYNQLQQAGFPVGSITADKIRLIKFGIEIPMIRSNTGLLGVNDYLLFYGEKNRSELDYPLFDDQSHLLNPDYSMFTDTASYYLSWEDQISTEDIKMIPNDLSAPLPKDEYFIQQQKIIFSEYSFKRGVGYGSDQKYPLFDAAQGYSSNLFKTRNFNLDMKKAYTDGPAAQISIRCTGFGDDNTSHRAHFRLDGVSRGTEAFAGYQIRTNILTVDPADFKDKFVLNIEGEASPEDRLSVPIIEMSYPAKFDFEQKKFIIIRLEKSIIRKYLEIENFDGGGEIFIYDRTNGFYLQSQREVDGKYRITIPESEEDRELIIWNPAIENQVQNIRQVQFKNFEPADHNYIILYHPSLRNDGSGNDYVQHYADYRSSVAGGSFDVAMVNVEELYDVFAYGIHSHSLAVRNFSQYAKTIWPKMDYMFIIGKGLEYPYYRQSGIDPAFFFVPTFCSPAADAMLVSDNKNKQLCAFGRLPVINGSEIKSYLEKVQSHEALLSSTEYSIQNREWQKRIIHLSGGDPQIYALISSQLAGMERVIEAGKIGAQVETFYKQNSSTIEVANSEKLRKFINEGSSIISFMGHSAAIRLDFNLENVDSYKNKDYYHLFIAMGCYAGSLFAPNRSISEDHNLAPEKGSILYLANTTAGFPDILGLFGNEFYGQLGGGSYSKSVGMAVKETVKTLAPNAGERLLTQLYSVTLNGDPAIHLNHNPDQDYTIDPSTISTEPSLVFSTDKEFELRFDVVSLGQFNKDSILLTIEKQLPNGTTSTVFNSNIANPGYRSQISLKVAVEGQEAIGYNNIYIKLDGNDVIAEGPAPDAENNNELYVNGNRGFALYIFGNEARPIFPKEFSIISQDIPRLIACNSNTLADQTRYLMELDTSEYFDSPLKQNTTLNQTGGVISWQTTQSLLPNVVYYWRVSPDSTGSGQLAWRNSSFIYIPGSSPGWNQSHYFQHIKNDFTKLKLNEPDRTFKYSEAFIEFRANNGYIELPTYIRPRIYVGTDVAADYQYWNYSTNFSGIVVNVFDPVNGRMWINKTGGDFNSFKDNRYTGKNFFVFKTATTDQRTAFMDFLENSIPKDHVVVISTLCQYNNSYFPDQWESDGSRNIYSVLEGLGATQVRSLRSFNSIPYLMIFRKDRPDFEVKESLGNFTDENEISHSFTIPQTAGNVNSRLVGPAQSWYDFSWDYSLFKDPEDQQEINIYGVDKNGQNTLLFGPLNAATQDLSSVDAAVYPQILLEWKTSDTTNRTSPNLEYWRIHHRSLPDAAFHPAQGFKMEKDTINQGETFSVEILSQNIGEEDLDSLLVKFTVVDQSNKAISSYKRFLPMASLATQNIIFSFKSESAYGPYKLFIELNPDKDQEELHTFNNTAIIPFFIRRDKRKPYMDVSFDNNRILNQEIVSSKSRIEISLQDENFALLLNDTNAFILKLKEPGGTPQRVYFGQQNVQFVPATISTKKVKAIIQGDFKKDGIYTLYVTAYDASGNTATDLEYIIDFTIVTKSSVANLFNYPNPFVSKTRFVYTLTGDHIPDYYTIQILSVSGKVVREITKEELGPLQIGTHMTEYEYNGTDQFGERLANGVYLYRFIVKDQNKGNWDKYNTNTDQYFKNDFGKMVILR